MMPVLKIYKPPISYMPYETSLLSILMGNESFSNWIDSNMVQVGIKILPDDNNGLLTPNLYFVDNPNNIEINAIPIKLLKEKNISYYIKIFIENGYYVFMYIDKYYLPNYHNYRVMHDVHSLLVYGMENGKMYIADFFRNGKYTFETCSASSIDEGAVICQSVLYNPSDKESDLLLLKPTDIRYKFCVNTLLDNLKDYLNSRCSNGENETSEFEGFGKKNYLYIYNYLERLKVNEFNIDYRMFSFHLSHKILLLNKINKLSQNFLDFSSLFEKIKQMVYLCKLNQSLALKYNFNKKIEILDNLEENIYSLSQMEEEFMKVLIGKCNNLNIF